MNTIRTVVALAAAAVTAASCAQAKEMGALDPANPFVNDLRPNVTAEEFVARALRPFDQMSPEGEPISREYLANKQTYEKAQRRAQNINSTLRYDLNSDFNVTNNEVLQSMQTEASRRVRPSLPLDRTLDRGAAVQENAERFFSARDTNRNGVIELVEAAMDPTSRSSRPERLSDIDALAASSLGDDGQVTRAEIKRLAERTFAAADRNHDGRISQEESASVREAAR